MGLVSSVQRRTWNNHSLSAPPRKYHPRRLSEHPSQRDIPISLKQFHLVFSDAWELNKPFRMGVDNARKRNHDNAPFHDRSKSFYLLWTVQQSLVLTCMRICHDRRYSRMNGCVTHFGSVPPSLTTPALIVDAPLSSTIKGIISSVEFQDQFFAFAWRHRGLYSCNVILSIMC